MRLETLVHEKYDRMSPSDHIIWEYICHHREECRGMSLHQLADACQVSHTTILRFIQLLGMDGFGEFKFFLKWEESRCPIVDERSVEQTCFDLTRTVALIEKRDCTELFQRMDTAANIYAYGSGSVQKSAAKALKCFFIVEEKLINVIEGREEREMAMRQMQPGDVVFLLSVSGNNPSINTYAQKLRELGVYLVSICQDGANELARLCDFQIPFYTQKLQIGRHGMPYYSAAGMFIIAETLSLKYAAYQAGGAV